MSQEGLLVDVARAGDFRRLAQMLEARRNVEKGTLEAVAKALSAVEFGRFTITPGFWSSVAKVLPKSEILREAFFSILRGNAAATHRTADWSHLLNAVAELPLSADELAILRRLRERLDIPAYKEDVDVVLFEHASDEDRVAFTEHIWTNAAARAVGRVAAPAASEHEACAVDTDPREAEWMRSAFRLLVCMPFRDPLVSSAWTTLRTFAASLGNVIRLDWSTDDWIRDVRRLVGEASFVLVDLSGRNVNVRRELGYLLRREVPHVVYAHDPGAQDSTVGQLHPEVAGAESVDMNIWGERVYSANYEDERDLRRLVRLLDGKISPFRDAEDPTGAYVGRDLSGLRAVERRGFALARVPRARASAERILREGKELIAESAIFRARVFSWLAEPQLHLHSPENLWLREHLLMLVRHDLLHGHGLSDREQRALDSFHRRESYEHLRLLAEDFEGLAASATIECPARRHGLPAIPPELRLGGHKPPATLALEFSPSGEPLNLRATAWDSCFGQAAEPLRLSLVGRSGPIFAARIFSLQAAQRQGSRADRRLDDLEEVLDESAIGLSEITLAMTRARWSQANILTFLQSTVSLLLLREMRRLGTFQVSTDGQEHERVAAELAYVWQRPASDLSLFEFASKDGPHFRGLLPWVDVKERVMRGYAKEAVTFLRERGVTEAEVFEQSMSWECPPPQVWEVFLRTRMCDDVPADVMRSLWCRYLLPSAFVYWQREHIYTDPSDTKLWARI